MADPSNDRTGKPFATFRDLPLELRLRVLEYTHLGPAWLAGYDPGFERLFIRDGKLEPGIFTFVLRRSVSECCRPMNRVRKTPAPRCRCRKLPTALFLVDRQMYQEAAVQVFYSNAHFEFYQDDLRLTLSFLRDIVPREALARIRRISFTMTPSQCGGWAGGRIPPEYPTSRLEYISRVHCAGSLRPALNHQSDWRAVLALLAKYADPARLELCVNVAHCTSLFVSYKWLDVARHDEFRFIYDFIIDVVTALCCSFSRLGSLELKTHIYSGIRPWLEREVLGCQNKDVLECCTDTKTKRHKFWYPPPWHDLDQRLEGSNYRPSVSTPVEKDEYHNTIEATEQTL